MEYIMKKYLTILITLMLFLSISAKDYSLENFITLTQDRSKNEEVMYNDLLSYYQNSEDILVLRNATGYMDRINHEKTLEILQKESKNNSNDKLALYLYARLLDDHNESLKLSRKIIKLDKEWEYGYRLLTNIYVSSYFESIKNDEMNEMFKSDKNYFEIYKNMEIKDFNNYFTYYKYLVFSGEYKQAYAILEEYKTTDVKWITDMEYARLYALMKEYKRSAVILQSVFKDNFKSMSQEDRLVQIEKVIYGEVLTYRSIEEAYDYMMQTTNINKIDKYSILAAGYLEYNNSTKAIKYLDMASEEGFDRIYDLDIPLFKAIAGNKSFERVKAKIKANWEIGASARKTCDISSKFKKEAPETTFTDVNGKTYSLKDLKGKIVILDFWATWCDPCQKAMPILSKFAETKPEDVEVISVNVWERDPEAAKIQFAEKNFKMKLAFGEESASTKFGFNGIPYICVIDKQGNIRFSENGFSNSLAEKLGWWVEELQQEKE